MILKMGKSHENKQDNSSEEHHHNPYRCHVHGLRLEEAQGPFKCNGCKQPGLERCYKCPEDICDFYLHKDCYQAIFQTEIYPTIFMEECESFKFHKSTPKVADKYCDACGLDILGFRYECSKHGENSHDLHPTCANIKSPMDWHGLKLELREKDESKCLECKQRYPVEECVGFTGWKWVSEKRHYNRYFPLSFWGRKICFHVKCMNKMRAPKEKKFDEI